ncbi:MAG: response regulator [Desulfobacterales bacterium]|nr:response regulator [Desulfobacterales bacterium]
MPHTILSVDDQQPLLDLLREALQRESYQVFCAASAEEALTILSRQQIDLIISDEKMPGMSGTKLLTIVRKKYPEIVRIMLTGHANLNAALRAINEGEVYRFFTKPCNLIELTVAIRQALQQKDLLKENQRLMDMVRKQSLSIKTMEKRYPGISKVKRDPGGAIIIDEDIE